MQRSEDHSSTYVAYDALATEMILHRLGDFAPSIQWCDQFEELDNSTQRKLRDIDKQIQQFTELEFPPDDERLQRLLMIFFDCYFGFQQRQDTGQPDAYESLIREPWQRRFRKYKTYQLTNKKILCAYSGGIDYSMRLNTYWMSKVIQKVACAEGKSTQHLIRELGEFLQTLDNLQHIRIPAYLLREVLEYIDTTEMDGQRANALVAKLAKLLQSRNMPSDVQTPTDLLKAILGYIKLTSSGLDWTSKVDLRNEAIEDMWDLIDLMNEIVQDAGGRESLGGAAVTGAQTLVTLHETDVCLLVPFVPKKLLSLLDPNLTILWYATNPDNTMELHECKSSALMGCKHPEIRNFIIEFSPGAPIVYCPTCGGSVMPRRTDRLIVRNRYAYYLLDGRIDRATTQQNATRLKVNGLFGFDSGITGTLSRQDHMNLAQQAAEKGYDLLLVSGLQSLDKTAHKTIEEELERFNDQDREIRIHIEISGDKNLDWLVKMIPKYIFSVGVGEELNLLFQAVKEDCLEKKIDLENELEALSFERLEAELRTKPRGYQKVILALEVARTLKLQRLYVHGVDMDIIVRKGELNEENRLKEIQADLIAKWVVLRKLMTRGQITTSQARDTMTQVKEEGFTTLIETARALYRRLRDPPDTSLELYGKYFPEYGHSIIFVPVRWVYGAMQDQLRVTGAGDTTSIVSAAQAIEKPERNVR